MGKPLEALGPRSIISALGSRRFAPAVMREDCCGVGGKRTEQGDWEGSLYQYTVTVAWTEVGALVVVRVAGFWVYSPRSFCCG